MAIVLENISKSYGPLLVVNNVSIKIEKKEFFVLLGSSGSGKSTILRMVAGLLRPDRGKIILHNRDVTDLPPQLRGTGFVFQNYAIFKHMTVAGNVEFGLKIRGVPGKQRRQKRDALLEMVSLTGFAKRYPSELSGGQCQRVALARALAYEPAVLLLDEPFSALDVQIRSQLRQTLRDIQQNLGVTAIFVTHDQEEAFELADRIAILEKGRLVEIGRSEDLYHRPKHQFAAGFLGGGNVVVGRAEKSMIRLGTNRIPFPEEAAVHEEGAPVRVLFRPENVRYQSKPFAPEEGIFPIGQAKFMQYIFAGSTERIRFALQEMAGTRPVRPALKYGQRYATIEALSFSSRSEVPVLWEAGLNYWIGLTHYHVLDPSALSFLVSPLNLSAKSSALHFSALLAEASHGRISVLDVSKQKRRKKQRGSLKESIEILSAETSAHFEYLHRSGSADRETFREAQAGDYDVVIIDRPTKDPADHRKAGRLAKRILLFTGLPVLFAGEKVPAVRRMLICTAAGEPGKQDVRFGARLARHLKSPATIFNVVRQGADSQERQRVENHLKQAQEMFAAYNVPAQHKIGHEPVIEEILAEINGGEYDFVVIGAPGSGKTISGEFIANLVNRINCSLLIVPSLGA